MDYAQYPSTRKEAKKLGVMFFFTGEPCKWGHIAPRYVSSNGCCVCREQNWQRHYKENREEIIQKRVKYEIERFKNDPEFREKERVRLKNYFSENPEKKKEANDKYSKKYPERRKNSWAKKNYKRKKAANAYSSDELTEFAFEEARELCKFREQATGFPWEVDHVVPLLSDKVCGLHKWTNFAVIPASVNRSKQNRYWPDMP